MGITHPNRGKGSFPLTASRGLNGLRLRVLESKAKEHLPPYPTSSRWSATTNLPGNPPRPHVRRILPTPALTKRPPSPPPQQPPPKARAPNVVAACEECRKHKCRCSGEKPTCSRCLKRSIHCRYRELVTPELLKQTNNDLRDRGNANEEILQLLKNLPDQEAQDVLARLRSGASVSTIVNQVKAGDLLLQLAVAPETRFRYEFPYRSEMPAEFVLDNPYLNSTLYKAASLYSNAATSPLARQHASASATSDQETADLQSLYLRPFHAAHMVDPRLSDARPSLWTAVCDDDVLMRDLLAVWFRCEYQFTSACQKDYFLEDMVNKRQDYCSSLLVNIVLAYACVCYPRFSNRAEYWNPHTLLYRFLAEAKRLWELEAAEPRLTTIQAGLFFNVFHNLCGLDEIGQAYRIHAIALAHELGFYDGPITAPSEKMRKAKIYTAWALYSWESLVGFSFMIPPLLKEPPHDPLPDPAKDAQWYGEIWVKYPSSQVLTPTYFGYGFKAKCDFRLLMNEFCHAAYSTGSGGSVGLDEANKLRKRLVAWYDGLSRPLLPENIVFPSQLQLHMYYHNLLLSIYEPLLDAKTTKSPSPHAVVADATRYLQTLIRLYYLRHGFESMDLFLVVPLVHAGFHCIDDIHTHGDRLPPERLEVLRSTLILIAKGLHSQRSNHYLAEALFRVVRGRMRLQEASLLKTTLHFDEGEDDRKSAMVQAVRSHWPVTVVKKKEDLDEHILGNLVENYAHLNVEGEGGGDGGGEWRFAEGVFGVGFWC
ncbi:Nitrogen assimilation transcription factor nit-4 [Apiospora marii]|uniref:Nitrogen assimilation transcription factor nit-4 n=1 Tax=Apiospora marii TaxID=335849 RepID=A0ABR1RZC8_9PEZI